MKRQWLIILVIGGFAFAGAEPNSVDATDNVPVIEASSAEAIFAAATEIQTPHFRLLPLKTDLTDGNPLPLYLNVFSSDPNFPELAPDFTFIDMQLEKPAKAMDMAGVKKELEKCESKLELLQQCSLCKTVEWPAIKQQYQWRRDDRMMMFAVFPSDDKPEYEAPVFSPTDYLDFMLDIQRYGKLVALKARYHIVRGDYEQATSWLRVGLCISRELVIESNLQLGMAAVSNAALMLQQIELWVQTPGSPSLYRALGDLPQPFFDAARPESLLQTKTAERHGPGHMGFYDEHWDDRLDENEAREVLPDYSNEQFTHAAGQIDRYLAILESIEALRYYAAIYDGDLPQRLADITELRLPIDPVTRRPFAYSKGAKGFTLKAPDWDVNESRFGFNYTFRFMTPLPKD